MPAPSKASLIRKARGIEDKPKDTKKQSAGLAGAIKRHKISKATLDGRIGAKVAKNNADLFLALSLENQKLKSINECNLTLNKALPLASSYMLDLITGVYEDASHTTRLEAAKTVLKAGGLLSDKPQSDDKQLSDMRLDELQAFIIQGAARLQELSTNTVEGELVEPDQ